MLLSQGSCPLVVLGDVGCSGKMGWVGERGTDRLCGVGAQRQPLACSSCATRANSLCTS